ncbi:MAG: Crp/Fnr family transcriptional regulator [Acidobacteriaceae bacterium]
MAMMIPPACRIIVCLERGRDLCHSSMKFSENDSMTLQEKLEMLLTTQLFHDVPAAALKPLARGATERHLRPGEILFLAGEPAQGLYAIVSGSMRAFRESEEGREQTIHIERAGATFAEVPVFDGGLYPSTVMAEEESVVLFLTKEDVLTFLRMNPEAALSALAVLAGRLRNMASLVEGLSLRDVMQRLSAMLLEEAERHNGKIQDGDSFSLPDSHQRLAARLGSVREVVTRHLNRLSEEGLIAIHGHRITILKVAALKAKAKRKSHRDGRQRG